MPSTVIHGMLYSPGRQTLDIVFRDDRGTYRYFDVTSAQWNEFKRAPSKGTYLNTTFKAGHPRFARFGDLPTQFTGSLAASLEASLAVTTEPALASATPEQGATPAPLRTAARDYPDSNVWGFFDQI